MTWRDQQHWEETSFRFSVASQKTLQDHAVPTNLHAHGCDLKQADQTHSPRRQAHTFMGDASNSGRGIGRGGVDGGVPFRWPL